MTPAGKKKIGRSFHRMDSRPEWILPHPCSPFFFCVLFCLIVIVQFRCTQDFDYYKIHVLLLSLLIASLPCINFKLNSLSLSLSVIFSWGEGSSFVVLLSPIPSGLSASRSIGRLSRRWCSTLGERFSACKSCDSYTKKKPTVENSWVLIIHPLSVLCNIRVKSMKSSQSYPSRPYPDYHCTFSTQHRLHLLLALLLPQTLQLTSISQPLSVA